MRAVLSLTYGFKCRSDQRLDLFHVVLCSTCRLHALVLQVFILPVGILNLLSFFELFGHFEIVPVESRLSHLTLFLTSSYRKESSENLFGCPSNFARTRVFFPLSNLLIQTFRSMIQAKLWNIRQCKLLFSLVGHNGCVFCVDLDDACKRAFSGSGDRVSNET